jgi:hypothetical protein
VSVLRVGIDRVDRQGPGCRQLLALFAVRRDLEPHSPNQAAGTAEATMSRDIDS